MAERFVPENANEEAMKAGHWVEGQTDPDVNNQHVQHVLVGGDLMQLISAAESQLGNQGITSEQQIVIQNENLQQFSGEVVTEDGRKVTQIIVDGNMQLQFVTESEESEEQSGEIETVSTNEVPATTDNKSNETTAVRISDDVPIDEIKIKEGKKKEDNHEIQMQLTEREQQQSKTVTVQSKQEKVLVQERVISDKGGTETMQVTAHVQHVGRKTEANVEIQKENKYQEEKIPEPEPGMVLSLCPVTGKYINVPAQAEEEDENIQMEQALEKPIEVKHYNFDIGRTRDLVAHALAVRKSLEEEAFAKPDVRQRDRSAKVTEAVANTDKEAETTNELSVSGEPGKSDIVYLSDVQDTAVFLNDSDNENEDLKNAHTEDSDDDDEGKSASVDSEANGLRVIDGISAFYTPVTKTTKMNRQVTQKSKYSSDVHLKTLMNTLQEQRLGGKNCDLIFLVNNDQYWAHKCIVSGHTDYFNSMMDVRPSSPFPLMQVNISGIMKASTLKILLDFLYLGSVDLNYGSASSVVPLAAELGENFQQLIKFCSEHIASCINKANFAEILELASKNNLNELYNSAIDYVNEQLDNIVQTEELMGVPYETVKEVVMKSNIRKSHAVEHTKLQFICNWVVFDTSDRMDHYDELCSYINYSLVEKPVFELMMKSELCSHANLWEHPVTLAIVGKNEFASRTRGRPRKSLPVSLKARMSMDKEAAELEDSPDKDSMSVPVKKRKYNPKDFEEGEIPVKLESEEEEDAGTVLDPNDEDYVVATKRKRGRPKGNRKKAGKPRIATVTRTGRLVRRNRNYDHDDAEDNKDSVMEHLEGSETVSKYSPAKGRKIFFCPRDGCSFLSRDRQRLIDHISMKHDGIKRHACSVCNKHFSSTRHLHRHKKLHLNDKPIGCEYCDYNTTRNDLWKNHLRHQHPDKAVEKGIMTNDELVEMKIKLQTPGKRGRKPKIKVSPEAPLECTQCDKTFTSLLSMKAHMKGHGVEEPLLCETCGFSTKHYASMRLHRLNHSGLDPPYKCHIEGCTYASFRKSRLTDHVNKHLNIRNFICSVCGKGFTTRKHMTRHELTHCEAKPFMCQECDYGTARSDKLKEHMRSRHIEKSIELGLMSSADIRTSKLNRRPRPSKKTITPVTMVPKLTGVPKIPVTTQIHQQQHQQQQNVTPVSSTGSTMTNLQPAQTHTLVYTGNQPGTVQVQVQEAYSDTYSTVSEEVMAYFAHYQEYESETGGQPHQLATIHVQPHARHTQQ